MRLKRTVAQMIGGLWGEEPKGDANDVLVARVADFDYGTLGMKPVETMRNIPIRLQVERRLQSGDLLIEKSGGGETQNVGRVVSWSVAHPVVSSNFINVLRCADGYESRFLKYLHRHLYVAGHAAACTKQTTGIQNLDLQAYFSVEVDIPGSRAQMRIADFLDRECARIDELTKELAGLQGELAADRIDRISRALVGLPEIRLRYRLAAIDQGWSPQCEERPADEGDWGVLKAGCVNHFEFRPAENKRLPADLKPRPAIEVRIGDVLMSRANTRELAGSVALVTQTGWSRLMMSDKLYRLTPSPVLLPAFAALVLNSRRVRDQIEIDTTGASASMQNISQQLVRSLLVPDCPVETQRTLIDEADRSSASYRSAGAEIGAISDRLSEYRDALITEAVTGQLDIAHLADAQMEESLDAIRHGERREVLAS